VNLKYGKPPITEAIFDIRVEPRPDSSLTEIDATFAPLYQEFPNRQQIPAWEGVQISFGSPFVAPHGDVVIDGYRYESADKKRIIQARRDAFVFSLLPPYSDWGDFSSQAFDLWASYVNAWRPVTVTRAALRYVNCFDLTGKSQEEIQYYLGMLPRFPRSETFLPPQNLASFSLQMVLPQSDSPAIAIVNHNLLPTPPDGLSLILDIDIFREDIRLKPDELVALREVMNSLRLRKNDIFQASISQEVDDLLDRKQ
jgi:uncharacterized protein (TIGR04255 family)